MTDGQKRVLQQQLWTIADLLRGRMNADEFRDYMLKCKLRAYFRTFFIKQ